MKRSSRGDELDNPVRQKLYGALKARGRATSSIELARLVDLPLSRVKYHLDVLVGADTVRCAYSEPREGSLIHFYELNAT